MGYVESLTTHSGQVRLQMVQHAVIYLRQDARYRAHELLWRLAALRRVHVHARPHDPGRLPVGMAITARMAWQGVRPLQGLRCRIGPVSFERHCYDLIVRI